MRRKVIQDFANTFCQNFLDSPSGYDLARFAYHETGTVILNILTGECLLNGLSISTFHTCNSHRSWLQKQLRTHHLPEDAITNATLTVRFAVSNIEIQEWYGPTFRLADFDLDCASEIQTDEKSYVSQMSKSKRWGYFYYWEQLYGKG